MDIKNIISQIEQNKQDVLNGIIKCIPSPFPKLNRSYPGIVKGDQVIVTAASGIGKSQVTKYLYMYHPYQWVKSNPQYNISLKIIYFALEESEQEFVYSVMSNYIYTKYGVSIGVRDLMMLDNKPLDDKILGYIKESEEFLKDFFNYVEVISSISNPTGIYKKVKEYSRKTGVHYYYNFISDKNKQNVITEDEYFKLENKEHWAYSHYVPNNPNEFVIVVVDHISLLSTEKDAGTVRDAMIKLSAEYGRKQITKHFNYTLVLVQQQSAETEKEQYTNMGENITEKLLPSLSNLAEAKITARDALIVLGLFSPARYNIENFSGYKIRYLQDNYRFLQVLKARYGVPNVGISLYFNGKVNLFSEMPHSNIFTDEKYKKFYQEHNK